MTELPALRESLREIAERRHRRRRPRRALPALIVAAAAAAALFVIADRDGGRPDPEVAATPAVELTPTATAPVVQVPTPRAIPHIDDLTATPVAPDDPSLREALSLLDPSHKVVRAWSVPGLKGHVLLTRKGEQWCLSAPDPLTDQPDAERGMSCAPSSRHESHGDFIGIGNVTITLPPGSDTLKLSQR
jgi:hypothetical protein